MASDLHAEGGVEERLREALKVFGAGGGAKERLALLDRGLLSDAVRYLTRPRVQYAADSALHGRWVESLKLLKNALALEHLEELPVTEYLTRDDVKEVIDAIDAMALESEADDVLLIAGVSAFEALVAAAWSPAGQAGGLGAFLLTIGATQTALRLTRRPSCVAVRFPARPHSAEARQAPSFSASFLYAPK